MQYLKLLVLLLLVSSFYHCKTKDTHSDNAATVRFEERTFNKQSSTCATDSMRCATVEITYPEAVAGAPDAVKAINDTVQFYVLQTLMAEEGTPVSIEAGVDEFITSYEAFIQDSEQDSTFITPWEIQTNAKVMYQSDKYITIDISNYSYAGGAHPNSYETLLVFDPKTGQKLTVTDLVSDTARLKTMAEAKFREARELSPNANLTEEGYFWDGPFALPANIGVTDKGLYFVYNPYEAAAYALGSTDFTISYEALKGILKE